jgi:hypothetical protein
LRALLIGLAASFLVQAPALAGSVSGQTALALAEQVAKRDPYLSANARAAIAAYASGERVFLGKAQRLSIFVPAVSINCRIGARDLNASVCEITYKNRKYVNFYAGDAFSLFSTLSDAGAARRGGTGSIAIWVSGVACRVVIAKTGSGATCVFTDEP